MQMQTLPIHSARGSEQSYTSIHVPPIGWYEGIGGVVVGVDVDGGVVVDDIVADNNGIAVAVVVVVVVVGGGIVVTI